MATVSIIEAYEQDGNLRCLVEVTDVKGTEGPLLVRKWLLFDPSTTDNDVKAAILADADIAAILTATKTKRSALIGPIN